MTQSYEKLEQRLTLLEWLNNLFGYPKNRLMLEDMGNLREGFDASGRSYLCQHLKFRAEGRLVLGDELDRYDDHIYKHLAAMNEGRIRPITLRYFQYLAVLYTEILLDWLHNRPGDLLYELNSVRPGIRFARDDLRKLAFWMATGSGKTLIMHINYRQFMHYTDLVLDNILLITPNEGLSEQHREELILSGIPCQRFSLNENGLLMRESNEVQIIEITKLVGERRGNGARVPVEAFEGNNLLFVDEGHKGTGGEVWRKFRDALGKAGFTFEYSATFGQALTAAKNDQLTLEYGKSIIFDYSYRYFYADGYGKDFHILNLEQEVIEDQTEVLLMGNLLSFYEQKRVFIERRDELQPYNLESPLWVFVGSTVNAVYTENRQQRSDVLDVVCFLNKVLENRNNRIIQLIEDIFHASTGLLRDDKDVFAEKFPYLRAKEQSPEEMYRDILDKVFHTPTGGNLRLHYIRGCPGEIGMRAGNSENYFGLIYIGDTSKFKNHVDNSQPQMIQTEDAISESLFNSIGRSSTTIDVLIGAKKFMDGWNSWRVSSMGLLKVGRREGSEIIQLFGRGVRLRGRGFTLKRSVSLGGTPPKYAHLLETLNIFSVRSNYMARFREYLEKEGVEIEGRIEKTLEIKTNLDFLSQKLFLPRVPESEHFVNDVNILFEPDPKTKVSVNMAFRAQITESGAEGFESASMRAGLKTSIPAASMNLVDWQRVYLELLDYKEYKGYTNLVICPETPKEIIAAHGSSNLYELIVADELAVSPKLFAHTTLLHNAVLSILRKYMDKYYRRMRERWELDQMIYMELKDDDTNFQNYTVKIAQGERALIDEIEDLVEKSDRVYLEDRAEFPSIYFDRHLYQPLLVSKSDKVKSDPPGLNEGEYRFVKDLRSYCQSRGNRYLEEKEIYLLRNQGPGRGIKFFQNRGFYPDFILWIKDDVTQRIIFIEPHGMIYADAYLNDEKARLHVKLPDLAKKLEKRTNISGITLDSFIISVTPFEILRKKYDDGQWDLDRFTKAHILFLEQHDYLSHIMMPASIAE